MNDRLLVLSRYSRMGASSRLRTLQYNTWLSDAGFEPEYAALFDDRYLKRLYSGQGTKSDLLSYYGNRISKLSEAPKPKLIWVEYEALPWLPWIVERALLPTSVPIVSDYDDAVFHRYDQHRITPLRWLLGKKIDRMMQGSQLVTAGNEYLAGRARHAGAARVEIVPTVVDLSNYPLLTNTFGEASLRVGWIGTPETWAAFGESIYNQLDDTLINHGTRFLAIGAQLEPETAGSLDIVPWSEDSEVSAIQSMDIGIMPLTDTPWTHGKCGYKLIQYMACGLPVVASPVGVNKDIVEHGVNGFLAESEEEWRSAIKTLLSNKDLRHRMGEAGRRKVEEEYSLQVWGPRVASMMRGIADKARAA